MVLPSDFDIFRPCSSTTNPCVLSYPHDVRTAEDRTLADDMTQAIAVSLKGRGFQVVPVALVHSDSADDARAKLAQSAALGVLLTVNEWRSQTKDSTFLFYDVTLRVLGRDGHVLGERRIHGRDSLGGSVWNAPAHAREAVPRAFKAKLEQLLNDEVVVHALRGIPLAKVATRKAPSGQKVNVGAFTAAKPGQTGIMCRLVGPITTPDGRSFEEYVRRALIDEGESPSSSLILRPSP